MPPTGVVLPFISYGGSGVVIFMAMMGLLLNVSKQASTPIPAKKFNLPFVVAIPKDNKNTIRGLVIKERDNAITEIEQQKRSQRRRK